MKSIVLAAALAVLSVCAAHAQQSLVPCTVISAEEAERQLSENHGEVLRNSGLDARGSIVVVWANPETGSWTLALVDATGTACIVGFGEFWQEYEPEPNL